MVSSRVGLLVNSNFCVSEVNGLLSSLLSPYRIVDDCGGAFAMGAIGGSVFSAFKGYRNAPPVS